jgi:hypothetical protein
MNPQDIVATRVVEPDLSLYDSFIDYAWVQATAAKTDGTRLDGPFCCLSLAWKEAANTHRLPWLMITQMERFVVSQLGIPSLGLQLVEAIKSRILSDVGDSVSNMGKKKVRQVVDKLAEDVRAGEAAANADNALNPHRYWQQLLAIDEFQLSVSGSQRLAFCALIFAYECFLVDCYRLLGGLEKHKPNEDRFWDGMQTLLSRDSKPDYWDHTAIRIGRIARNCFAHTGGKAKPELVAENPNLYISPGGDISVQPSDNRNLYTALKNKVEQLIGEVLPKLASVAA